MSRDEAIDRAVRQALADERPRSVCPAEERWVALALGEVAAPEAGALHDHLEACARCATSARDARRFLAAMELLPSSAGRSIARHSLALASAAALVGVGLLVLLDAGGRGSERQTHRAVERLVAELTIAAPAPAARGGVEEELVYRGPGAGERAAALEQALVPYRESRFRDACAGLIEHGRRFPADREGRFFAAVACLEAGDLERADELLAELAASVGDRRDEALALRARLRRAREEDAR